MVSSNTLASALGFAIVCYAAWDAVGFRSTMKLSHETFDGLPFNILLELVLGTVVACFGGIGMAGELRPISFLASEQSLSVHNFRSSFMTFNNRARAFREPSD
uniref:Uncharacterized protein n=1 Tax=Tetraselmis sp. GSL018 TaxID=582737 RepID=A0A061S3T9_9CHLO